MTIFISHSKRDADLVMRVKKSLNLLDEAFTPVVYEDLPISQKKGPDWDNIDRLVKAADMLLLFHTSNVEATKHTQAWVGHEAAVASAHAKGLVVFQILGKPPTMPLTYWTDLVVIDPERPDSILQVQDVVRRSYGTWRHSKFIRGLGGAGAGSILGPVGALAGAILGIFYKPKHPLDAVPKLRCNGCKVAYRYWVKADSPTYCPHCLTKVELKALPNGGAAP